MKHSSYFDILSNHLKILELFIQMTHSLLTSAQSHSVIPWLLSLMVTLYSTSFQIVCFLLWWNRLGLSDLSSCVHPLPYGYQNFGIPNLHSISLLSLFPWISVPFFSGLSYIFASVSTFHKFSAIPSYPVSHGLRTGPKSCLLMWYSLVLVLLRKLLFSLIKITFLCAYLVPEFKEGGNM